MNHVAFFGAIRSSLFHGKLTTAQVAGIESILKITSRITDRRHVAYMLATAYHETGEKMVPVREGFASTDAGARKIVAKYKYGAPDPVTGHVYYGRGHVQLTWAANYKTMGKLLGVDLYNNPDLALDPDLSARILMEGMLLGQSGKGDFTGKSLEDYFNACTDDPVGARRIINGTDKASKIASYHAAFLMALRASE